MKKNETMKKGNVKIVKGIFKMIAGGSPLLIAISFFSASIALQVDASKQLNSIYNDYRLTETYIERNNEDMKSVIEKYELGEISDSERDEQLKNLSSDDYVKSMIEEEREENVEFQARLDKRNNIKVTASILALCGSALNLIYFILSRKVFGKISDIGAEEIKEGIKLKKEGKYNLGASTVISSNGKKDIFEQVDDEIVGDLDEKFL